jgi:hypothetical protein
LPIPELAPVTKAGWPVNDFGYGIRGSSALSGAGAFASAVGSMGMLTPVEIITFLPDRDRKIPAIQLVALLKDFNAASSTSRSCKAGPRRHFRYSK